MKSEKISVKKSKNRTKILGAAAVVVVLATAPSWAPIESSGSLKQNASNDKEQAATLNKQADEASTVASDTELFSKRFGVMMAAIPDGPDLPGVIDQVGNTAQTAGLEWTTATPSRTTAEGTAFQTWSMNITLTGDQSKLNRFFNDLRTLDRYVTVESVTFQRITDSIVSVVATLHFYSLSTDDVSAAALAEVANSKENSQ